MSKFLIIAGVVMIGFGIFFQFADKLPAWFGRLPGDIYVKKDNFTFYFPIATSLLVSVIATLLLSLGGKR